MLETLRVILDNLTVGIVILDKKLTIKYANQYFKRVINEQIDTKLEEKNFGSIFKCKNSLETVMCGTKESCQSCDINTILKSVLETNREYCFEIESLDHRFKFVRDKNFEFRGSSLNLEGQEYIKLELHEVTQKKVLEETLKDKEKAEQQLISYLDAMEDLVFYMNQNGELKYFNKAYAKFLNKTYEEIVGKKESQLFPIEMIEKCQSNTETALEKGTFLEEEELLGKWFQTFKCRIELEETGEIGVLGVVRDISSQKKREFELKNLAYLDLLTGLFNRNFYEDKILEIMKENSHKLCTVMILDIDDFKIVNDTKGHEVGDQCLKDISRIILKNTRKEDYTIRMGGDEICIITFSDKNPTNTIGERILKEVKNLKYNETNISVSIGISTQTIKKETLEELYKKADNALYRAKQKGKGRMEN